MSGCKCLLRTEDVYAGHGHLWVLAVMRERVYDEKHFSSTMNVGVRYGQAICRSDEANKPGES